MKDSDSTTQARWFALGFNYLNSPWNDGFRTSGTHIRFGVNFARFFSKKFILGLYTDVKVVKGLTKQYFSDDFVGDFNSSFIEYYSDPFDSARANTVKAAINNSEGYDFRGNYFGNIGVSVSLFPHKYGGIIFTYKRGYRAYPVFGTYWNTYFNNGESDNVLLDLNKNHAFTIAFKPFLLFRSGNLILRSMRGKDYWQLVSIGFYYERTNLKYAIFDGMPVKNMVDNNFLNRYGVSQCFGFTFGLMVY